MPRAPRRRLSLEILEDRLALAVTGLPWPDATHLTLSFAADGTNVGGAPSALAQVLGAQLPASAWKADILRAFQTWADVANINIGLVPDNGAPVGQSGALQGNPNYGDIRITDRSLSTQVVALSNTFDPLNNWAGTVILNSNFPLGDGGPTGSGQYDLFTVALHEAGHVLGLPDSADPSSAMYGHYAGVKTALSSADVAALQALYGSRALDPNEGQNGNTTFATATALAFVSGGDGGPTGGDGESTGGGPSLAPSTVTGDIGTIGDADVYRVQVPPGTSRFAVDVKTSGVSLLTANVTVYNSARQAVATATATDPANGDLALSITSADPKGVYYVRVSGGSSTVFGVGGYRLAVGTSQAAQAAVSPATTLVFPSGWHWSGSFEDAAALSPAPAGAGWTYTVQSTLIDPFNGDYYQIQTAPNAPSTMLVTVYATGGGALDPQVAVFDAHHNPVSAQIVAQDGHSETLEVAGVASGATYFVKVDSPNPWSFQNSLGGYFLGMDLIADPLPLATLATNTLQGASNQDFGALSVPVDQVFHFDLSADSHGSAVPISVRLTIYDASWNPVFSMTAQPGLARRADVLLAPGMYTVRIVAGAKGGAALPPLTYTLRGLSRTDPIGPDPMDPTLLPSLPPPGPGSQPPSNSPPPNPGTTLTPVQNPNFQIQFGLTDPFGNPWPS